MTSPRYPNESAEYRAARTALLDAERQLRAQIEAVAAQRRALPPGGLVDKDYTFAGADGPVTLAQLFGDKDTLLLYSFMYGPNASRPCPLCVSFLDALNAQAPHLTQQVALAVTAKSELKRVREFTQPRGWSQLRMLSSAENEYNADYFGENEAGNQMPMMNVFTHGPDGSIRHSWGSELLFDGAEFAGDQRHIDILWPLWNLPHLTPGGRGEKFYPSLSYEA